MNMNTAKDIWRNTPLFKNTKVAANLAHDLIAIRAVFKDDIKLNISYTSLLQSISKENITTDTAIRTALLHLKTMRLTNLPKSKKEKIQKVIDSLDQWLETILAGGGHNFDFISKIA